MSPLSLGCTGNHLARLVLTSGALSLAGAFSSLAAAPSAANPHVSLPMSPFTVSGSLKFGGQNARMTHFYYSRLKSDDGLVLALIFSDRALPAPALDDRQRLTELARRKTFMGLYAEIDDTGNVKSTEMFNDDGSFSGSWSFAPTAGKKSGQAGRLTTDGEKEFFDKTFNVELSFAVAARVEEPWAGSDLYVAKPTGLAIGRAEGWMERHGQKSSLTYAVAVSETDLFGNSGERKIILSAAPATDKILATSMGPEQGLHAAGIAFLRVGLNDKNQIESVMLPAEDGNPINFSSNQWDLELASAAPSEFDGTVKTTGSNKEDSDFPQFDLRFHATTVKIGAAAPITADNGKSLPRDGGVPGQAYRDYLVALKNAKVVEDLLPRRIDQMVETLKSVPPEQHAGLLEFMKMEATAGYKIVGGFASDDQATLWLEGGTAEKRVEGRVNLHRDGSAWKIGMESFRSPPASTL